MILALAVTIAVLGHKSYQRDVLQTQQVGKYVTAHKCVVAQMSGQHPVQYRCDLPAERYLTTVQLNQEAQAEAVKPAPK